MELKPPPMINLELNLSDAIILRIALELYESIKPAGIQDRIKYLYEKIEKLEKENREV